MEGESLNKGIEDLLFIETPEQKIARLREKIADLESMCEAIEVPLVKAGLIECAEAKNVRPQAGIQINGKLSFRGMQMSDEYFDVVRESNGGIGFNDFRGMWSISEPYGIVHAEEFCNWESWVMTMADLGIKLDNKSELSIEEFCKFRKLIEPSKPLLNELITVHLNVLPHEQVLWRNLNEIIAEVLSYRSFNNGLQLKSLGERDANAPLTIDESLLILSCCGISFSRAEFYRHMLDRARFDMVLANMLNKSLKRNFGQSPRRYAELLLQNHEKMLSIRNKIERKRRKLLERIRQMQINGQLIVPEKKQKKKLKDSSEENEIAVVPDVTPTDLNEISPKKLIAWIFTRRPLPRTPSLYQSILQMKYKVIRYIRQTERALFVVSMFGSHLKSRKIYSDFRIEALGRGAIRGGLKPKAGTDKQTGKEDTGLSTTPGTRDAQTAGDGKLKSVINEDESSSSSEDEEAGGVDAGAKPTSKQGEFPNKEAEKVEKGEKSSGFLSDIAQGTRKLLALSREIGRYCMKPFAIRKEIKSTVDFGVEIGKVSNHEAGTGVSFKLSKIDRPDLFFVEEKLPKDCASVFWIDFTMRSDISEALVHKCAVALRIAINSHFGDTLSHHPLFKGIFSYTIESQVDGSIILRIAIAYKKMSIDSYLDQIYLPFSLIDLVPALRGSLSCNVHIVDALAGTSSSLDNMFDAKLDISCTYRRELIMSVLQRLKLALNSSVSEAAAKLAAERSELQKRAHDNLMKQLKDPEASKFNAAANTSLNNEVPIESTDQWSDIRPYFNWVSDMSTFVMNMLRGVKTNSVVLKFGSLGEFFQRLGLISRLAQRMLPVEFAKSHDYAANAYSEWTKYLKSNFNSIFGQIKKYLDDCVAEEENERRRILMSVPSAKSANANATGTADSAGSGGSGSPGVGSNQTKVKPTSKSTASASERTYNLKEKLNRLGISTVDLTEDSVFEVPEISVFESIKRAYARTMEGDLQAMQAWELLWQCCSGIHNITIISGKSKLSFTCQGFDIFDLFPTPPPVTELKESVDEIRRKGAENMKKLDSLVNINHNNSYMS